MAFVLSRSVNELVARSLGLEIEPKRWDPGFIGATPSIRDINELAAAIESVGKQGELSYLRRTLGRDEFVTLVRDGAVPIVLLPERGPGAFEAAVVVKAKDRSALTIMPVTTKGVGVEYTASIDEVWTRLSSKTLHALVPVRLTPILSDRGDGLIHDEPHEHLTPFARLRQLLHAERRDIGLIYLYAVLVGLFGLTVPLAVQGITQLVQGGLVLQPVVLLIVFAIVGTLITGVIGLLQEAVVETIQQRIFARLAFEFAYLVPRIRFEAAQASNLPLQMNRFFESVLIQKALSKLLLDIPTATLQVLFGVGLLSFYNPSFIVFAIVLVGGVYAIFALTFPRGLETSIMESKYKYNVLEWLQAMARSIAAFKFSTRSTLPLEMMDGHVANYLKYRKKHFKVLITQSVSMIIFKTLLTGALLILGTTLVVDRSLTLGQFVAAELVIVTVLVGVEKLIRSLATVYDVLTSVDKIGHVMDLPVEEIRGLQLPEHTQGLAIFARGLSFTYPDQSTPTLADIDLDIRPGDRIGITGVDGSGQTTLLRVIGALHDGYEGTLTYDGVTLRSMNRAALREQIGQVLSTTDLFDGTIEDNISVGRRFVDRQAVLQALRDVDVDDVVQAMPQGIQTTIINGGANLSAAVASKLLVAQGIVGKPRLLLLDDFFQNLDDNYRRRLIRLLTDRSTPHTVIAVSHDPEFLAACDLIIVMDAGRIREQGTYAELAGRLGRASVHGLSVPVP
ncbi:MAG: ATP-binding cassette domain-containing protein [Gemmatimonadaceae bacterium]|nr:ATP-binding cassette domain-containing protein [Gemmatimonadaceae bacterium]